MKPITASLIVAASAQNDQRAVGMERRYFQLKEMMENYNKNFDEKKLWAYGCNCLILGDRPMSDPGKGAPVDDLDKLCKGYKECLRCARREHGDQCIGEFMQYKFAIRKKNVVCRDATGTCERDLCECDAMFAKEHVDLIDLFEPSYSEFYGDWSMSDSCEKSGRGNAEMECCGGKSLPFTMFNAKKFECCADKSVAPVGTC